MTSQARPRGGAPPALHHLTVPRTARYATLGGDGPDVRELWIACHGYAELAADFIGGLGRVAAPHRRIVAPEALSRFYVEEEIGPHGQESRVGATWMTREDRLTEIEDYVTYIDRLHEHVSRGMAGGAGGRGSYAGKAPGAASVRLVALGYSQGAATVSRWAARTEAPLDELILWAGRLPPELEPAALAERWRRLRVTLAVGTRDRWMTEQAARAEEARLEAAGIRARVVTFEGGHRLDDEALAAIA